jgi:two-component system phosphate regulon sensor histidine kinase PhoR
LATSSSVSGWQTTAQAAVPAAACALIIAVALGAGIAVSDAPAGAVIAALALLALVGAGLGALIYSRLRQVRRLTELASALSGLRFDVRAPYARDELGPLTVSLNAAAENVGRLVGRLRQERAQLEALLNASSDATVAVDAAGVVTYMNSAAARLFTGEAALGRPFIEAVRDHDLNELIVSAAQRGERSVQMVAYGASQRWLQATAVPIEGGGDWAALAVFHDLTEVRRLDSMRRDFISNVSHELRTPLAGIRAAAETLHEGAIADPPAATEFVGHILRETDRLTQLVEELLELSRIESGAAPMTFSPLDANKLVQSAVVRFAQQAERAGITLTNETVDGELMMLGDAERLERALGNLIANALKFTDSGGVVTVSANPEGNEVAIAVRDTGIGIEPEQQGRVFERFFKADRGRGEGGTGLGLAIVKHIVLAHGGTVQVESRPGRGATFRMLLPAR